jgi:hypothetical protein
MKTHRVSVMSHSYEYQQHLIITETTTVQDGRRQPEGTGLLRLLRPLRLVLTFTTAMTATSTITRTRTSTSASTSTRTIASSREEETIREEESDSIAVAPCDLRGADVCVVHVCGAASENAWIGDGHESRVCTTACYCGRDCEGCVGRELVLYR